MKSPSSPADFSSGPFPSLLYVPGLLVIGEVSLSPALEFQGKDQPGNPTDPVDLIYSPVFNDFLATLPATPVTEESLAASISRYQQDFPGSSFALFLAGLTKKPQIQAPTVITTRKSHGNLTSQWLDKNWERVLPSLRAYIRDRLPVSRTIKTLDDHLQQFALKMIEKDRFRERLLQGEEIQLSVLKIWCLQTACTQIRGWGTDASLRASRGALTTRNREAMSKGDAHVQEFPNRSREVFPPDDLHAEENRRDYWNPDDRSVEEDAAFNETMEQCRQAIQDKLQGSNEYISLFDQLAEGANRVDLAEKKGISQNRMTAMVGKIRGALRDSMVPEEI